jgi:hypothetical protein
MVRLSALELVVYRLVIIATSVDLSRVFPFATYLRIPFSRVPI